MARITSTPETPPLIDTSQMNESEQQLVALFEKERGASSSSTDDPALNSAEDETEPTGTPGTPDESTAAPDAPTTVEGQSGVSESEPSITTPTTPTEPVTAEPATPVEGEATEPEPVLPDSAFTFAGVDYSSTDLVQGINLRNWYQNLNDNQIQSIDALLSGQYTLVPASDSVPTQPATSPASTSPAATTPPVAEEEAGEWLDPRAESEISRLRTELAQIRESITGVTQSITPIAQSQADQQLQSRLQSIDTAQQSFQAKYVLDDATMNEIGQAVVNAQIFPSMLRQHNNNVETAMHAALDTILWTTPMFRDKVVTNQLTALATDNQAVEEQDRKKKLTSLTGSGGSVPRRTTTPQTKDERHNAMVEAIRADMSGNGSI